MPYEDPDVDDPQELVGVELPGDETVTFEMAAAFADEFAQLGYTRPQILGLFRRAEYTGAHQAWTLLGEETIGRIVDESLAIWAHFTVVVTDSADRDVEAQPLRLFRRS
jgi:hypothetical protein